MKPKKLLTVALTGMLCLSLLTPTYAANPNVYTDNFQDFSTHQGHTLVMSGNLFGYGYCYSRYYSKSNKCYYYDRYPYKGAWYQSVWTSNCGGDCQEDCYDITLHLAVPHDTYVGVYYSGSSSGPSRGNKYTAWAIKKDGTQARPTGSSKKGYHVTYVPVSDISVLRGLNSDAHSDYYWYPEIAHTYGSWLSNDTQHWVQCSCCTATTNRANHTWSSWINASAKRNRRSREIIWSFCAELGKRTFRCSYNI